MSFEVSADAYGRFMGKYSEPLAVLFADEAGVRPGLRALDVGCGPGALTSVLGATLGADRVCAAEPSPPFAASVRQRLPGVFVARAAAERLPFADGVFDLALAQLVVHFMADPVAGLREMARVCSPGGTVAACVWDHAADRGPLSLFWRSARALDPAARDESDLAGAREGHLATLCAQAGLHVLRSGDLTVSVRHDSFDQWWQPFTLGVGPAGDHLGRLPAAQAAVLRERCREQVGDGPLTIRASAWTVVCAVPG